MGKLKPALLATASPSSSTAHSRAKAVSLLIREEKKSDRRQAVADALTTKLINKYAKHDASFRASIEKMVNRLLLNARRRILESDIVALEAMVKKMSMERSDAGGLPRSSQSRSRKTTSADRQQMQPDSHDKSSTATHESVSHPSNQATKGPSLPGALKDQEEWVLLNALTLVEYERDCEQAKHRQTTKQRMQREWLDSQRAEKEARLAAERQHEEIHATHQLSDVSQWHAQERAKKQLQRDRMAQVRQERDRQLQQQRREQEAQERKRKQEEADEVARIQRELKQQEDEVQRRRRLEHERMHKLRHENVAVQQDKDQQRLHEQQEDVKLMEAYAHRLAKEEEARMAALRRNLTRQDNSPSSVIQAIHKEREQKALDDERRAEDYQRRKNETDHEREQRERQRRREEARERQEFLRLQHKEKEQRQKLEVSEEMEFAHHFHEEGRTAVAAHKQQLEQQRHRNKEFQGHLVVQMVEQKKQLPISPLHLPRTHMNSRERGLNAHLLQKLAQPEVQEKVLQKLSPCKEYTSTHSSIPTTFY